MGNKEEKEPLTKAAANQGLTYIIGAFGFAAALAWNEAIKALITRFFPDEQNISSLFIYALVVTLVAVIAISKLTSFQQRFKSPQDEDRP